MRPWIAVVIIAGLTAVGCENSSADIPKVEGFTGRLVASGKPVQFAADEQVEIQFFTEKGQQLQMPIKSDGSFEMNSVPVGKHSVKLARVKNGTAKAGNDPSKKVAPRVPTIQMLADKIEVKEGQKEYTIELGKNFKP
jgi:hypothetical protein